VSSHLLPCCYLLFILQHDLEIQFYILERPLTLSDGDLLRSHRTVTNSVLLYRAGMICTTLSGQHAITVRVLQQIGCAGRDGNEALCIFFLDKADNFQL